MRPGLVGAALLGLALSGCATDPNLAPVRSDTLEAQLAQGFQLIIEAPDDGWLNADVAVDGARLSEAGQQTSRHLSSTMQGVANSGTGGGGAAVMGTVIGSMLLANLSQSGVERDARLSARRQIEPVNQALGDHDWADYYRAAYSRVLAEQGYAPATTADLNLRITPRLRFSEGMQVLRLVCEARVTHGPKVLYAGRIESFAEPEQCEDCSSRWLEQGATRLHAAANAGVGDCAALLASDWRTNRFSGVASQEQTLRYQLGATRHVERGRLLALGGTRSVFFSLRGWLKSMPVAVESY
ncbi:hypothetical protein [Ectopseudomonas composti]|uniref:hypothetical protein n=1 Tax=Ectopseudomonas composti TaxID=658457 RepID=UPI000A71880D|nr:hypothetical protein [Pseudomonas composti]